MTAVTTEPGPKPRRSRQLRYWIAAILCVGAIVALLIGGLSHNLVYFRTVSEAVKARNSTGDHRFRIAGAVKPGTIRETRAGVEFEITDGKQTVEIDHTGDPPELFKSGAPVVCEGRWGRGLVFDSDRILIKHGASYTPPSVDVNKAPTTGNAS
jgi:cytochrome c-type biogenesis protein CcmE